MRSRLAFLIACLLAAFAPWRSPPATSAPRLAFPGWPARVEGRSLVARPLAPREERFAAGFPGRIGAFHDGRRSFVLRWVTEPTRKLHPAADCFRGTGYEVEPLPLWRDGAGRLWAASRATRGAVRLRVLERIADVRGHSFTDVSSWYWSAVLDVSEGPWWAWTIVESDPLPPRH
jgi:hypothetical protein